MKAGRPVRSRIRERMQEIVDALGVSYGYEIFKVYKDVFEPINLRSIYYHLRKGCTLLEFQEIGEKEIKGIFTWGDKSVRNYYILGPSSKHKARGNIHIVLKTLGLEFKNPKIFVDWERLVKEKKNFFEGLFEKTKEKEDLKRLYNDLNVFLGWIGNKTKTDDLILLKNKIKSQL